uniref:Protein DGCR14 n=1 Tax=Manihot esculenta TaxID=3983 RepID=A0A2C9UTV8_MANES
MLLSPEKLRDRLDWVEAVKTCDPIQIRDAQLKIIDRRVKRANNSNADGSTQTRSRMQTPGSPFIRNFTPFDEFDNRTPSAVNRDSSGEHEAVAYDSLSLDDFFRRYTSEDNDSFSKILEKVNRKRKERYGYLLEDEKLDVKLNGDAKRNRITDGGYGASDQPPSTLKGWNYTANNLLMCYPSDRGEAPLTEEEQADRLKGLTKEINRSNTNFHGKMLDSRPNDDGTMEKAENGYSLVKTPSPATGVDESPFITWVEIEGTPLRLEPEDTPVDIGASSNGPHFKISNPPARDMKAHSLSREAVRKLRERSKLFQKPPLPSPVRGGSESPSPSLSKFMRNAISKSSSSIDESLRASYRRGSTERSVSRFGRDGRMNSRSPFAREDINSLW